MGRNDGGYGLVDGIQVKSAMLNPLQKCGWIPSTIPLCSRATVVPNIDSSDLFLRLLNL